jgi:hypothetical protein
MAVKLISQRQQTHFAKQLLEMMNTDLQIGTRTVTDESQKIQTASG